MHTIIEWLRSLIQRLAGESRPAKALTESETTPVSDLGPAVEEYESSSTANSGTSAIADAATDSVEAAAAQLGLPPATIPWHILRKAPARRSVGTGIANETLQDMVFMGADRFVRLRNYSGAIDDTGPVWTIDFTEVEPARIPPRELRKKESEEIDWDTLFTLTQVDDWDGFCARFFPGHLGHIAAYLPFAFSRDETREVFFAILRRLLEEGRLVHAQPGKTINELRRSPTRPLPLWGGSPEVATNCYHLHWPDLEQVDYVNLVVSYCAWYMQFAWVAWNEELLVARGLADEHGPGGLWYDSCEYAKAGDWAIVPHQKESAAVVDGLPLRRHLTRLGFASVDALARFHFSSTFFDLLRKLQLETLPREEIADVVLALLKALLQNHWLVHADPHLSWRQQLVQESKPRRSWQPDPQLLLDCLRIHWPVGTEVKEDAYFLCDLFEYAKHYSFAWVAKGRHKGRWVEEGKDTPGSLWYDGVEIAKPGEWE